jgi:hypothetical protein
MFYLYMVLSLTEMELNSDEDDQKCIMFMLYFVAHTE